MGDAKRIWKGLVDNFGLGITLGCKHCKPPPADSQEAERDLKSRCVHRQDIGIWVVRTDFPAEQNHWTFVREIPSKLTDRLCKGKNCQGGRRCGGAHSNAELHIWKTLQENKHHLHTFLPNLMYYEKEKDPADAPPNMKPVKKKRTRTRHNHHQIKNFPKRERYRDRPLNKFERVLQKCGGGRFFFACLSCYNLEPRIVKEMEIGIEKVPMLLCKWCAGKEWLLFHEIVEKIENEVTFYEYHVIRERLSTSKGNSLCRTPLNCRNAEHCTFAHSYLELQVWRLEAEGETRFDLVRHCDSFTQSRSDTLNGMFHCNRCCLSFTDHHSYLKYMGSNHSSSHFSGIRRPKKEWVYKPVPNTEEPSLCKFSNCTDECPHAHSQYELDEWKERVRISRGRCDFRLREVTKLEWFNFEQRPEQITSARNIITEVDPKRNVEIAFETRTHKWKLTIATSDEMKLKNLCFKNNSDFQIRRTTEENFGNAIEIGDGENGRHQFVILFKNPELYGQHIGDLFFGFDVSGKKCIFYLRFEVNVAGTHLDIAQGSVNADDWTRNRILIPYPHVQQHASYEKHVENLKKEYQIPKRIAENINLHGLTSANYAERMHALLYKEEQARREILSKLNMWCDLTFNQLYQNGPIHATFKIPLSVSTDEGTLFGKSCQMVLLGESGDQYAYEAKIVRSEDIDIEEVAVAISHECVRALQVGPGSRKTLQVQFQLEREPFVLRHDALDKIGDKVSLICPTPHNYASLQYDPADVKCEGLDEMQNAVFKYIHVQKRQEPRNAKINAGKPYPPLVVAGPFGTGKTYTIKKTLLHLLEHGDKNVTILLCTHSNSSANLYLKDQELQQWGTKILRLYYHGRNIATVEYEVLKFCLLNGRGFRYPSIDEIRKYRLVITTFFTALTLNFETGLSGNLFQYIFLDEASQAMEAEVIMPLVLADATKTKVVIAGDHRQITEKMYCDDYGLVQSLLERMYTAYEDVSKRYRILLTNNYRCVKDITALISKLFYKDNILQNRSRELCLEGMQSYYFIHLQGHCIPAKNGEYMNESEAYQIAHEVKMLVRMREDEKQLASHDDIVVVSAFRSQVHLLRQVLRNQGLRNISVQPVQNIQGQEYKVVILTTVMRRPDVIRAGGENFGFLSDSRLLNTTLTRAKSLIVVVGDAVTLCSTGSCEKSWKTYIKCCEEKQTILPQAVNIQMVRRQIDLARKTLSISAQEFIPGLQQQEQMSRVKTPSQGPDAGEEEEEEDEEEQTKEPQIDDEESSYDDDDTDSWCSEESLDDTILDDMIKKKIGIDLSKMTIGHGKVRDEYIQYGSADSASDDDSDPNETEARPSRRHRGKGRAIYPKFTIRQLEGMLESGGDEYVRCQIKLQNWFSARAIPILGDEEKQKKVPESHFEPVESDSSHEFDQDSTSSDEAYSLESDSTPMETQRESAPIRTNSDVIFIETRDNLGRTFDQDEVLVRVIEVRRDPIYPSVGKRIGKVLGVLRKRYKNPRRRRFLCCPDEFNSMFMCPIDKKLPKFAILAPKDHKQSARSDIPIYQLMQEKKKFSDLKFRKYEKLDERRVYVVRYLKWVEYCPYPLGFVEGSFERGDFRKYLKLEYGVPKEYKDDLQKQAKNIPTPEPGDIPVINVFTIDPEESMDLDDAISFEKCLTHTAEECYVIGIHITDVASVIQEGSDIDKEAQKRFATFYGGDDGPVHMLPSALGTEKCSLLPGETRPAISTFFHSCEESPTKKQQPVTPRKTFIRSYKRLTYAEAAMLLRATVKSIPLESDEDREMSENLYNIWRIIWDWRVSRLGGEAYYKKSDKYTDLSDGCRAHLLIEEAMISCNANTAAFLMSRDFEIPLRAQDAPDENEWAEWDKLHSNLIPNSAYLTSCVKYLKKLKRRDEGEEESEQDVSEDEGGQWEQAQSKKRKRKKKKQEISVVLASIDPVEEIHIFKSCWNDMLQCVKENDFELFTFIAACDDLHPSLVDSVDRYRGIQKKASFKSDDSPHFSLRLKKYAWSSSPIRRYVDILIQRCIHSALDGWPASQVTEESIKRVCRFFDSRHSQYQEKLLRAKVAEYLKNEPVVLEVAIAQITDAFMKIAVPSLGRHVQRYAREMNYGFLNITGEKKYIAEAIEEQKPKDSRGQIVLTNMELLWKLRFYRYSKVIVQGLHDDVYGRTIRVPVRQWRTFARLISSPIQRTASEFERTSQLGDLEEAILSMIRNAEEGEENESDKLTEETRNKPLPIKHRREIRRKVSPGTTFLMQFTGTQNKSRLPEPAVQLLSIAEDMDICIEHMRDPLDVFAPDADQVKYLAPKSIANLASYRQKWEPLVRMDAANNAVTEPSVTLQGVEINWRRIKKGKNKDSSEPRIVNYFSLQDQFCYERYIDFHHGDLLCLRLKDVPSEDCGAKEGHCDEDLLYSRPQNSVHTAVIHAVITRVKMRKRENTKPENEVMGKVKVFFEPQEYNFSDHQRKYIELPGCKWTIEIIPLSFPHRYMQRALLPDTLRSCSQLVKSICLGTIQPSRVSWHEELQHLVTKQLKRFKLHLNTEQLKQEQRAITHDFTIIQGPPGTGKSFLGAQIAAKFAYLNKRCGEKVLYCGPSNKSVDVAAGFLKDTDLKVVRQYSSGLEEKLFPNPLKPRAAALSADDGKTPDDNLKSMSLHELIRKPENPFSREITNFDHRVRSGEGFSRKEMDRYAAIVQEAKEIELMKADIIICTCSYSVLLSNYEGLEFGQCIIDECAMCSEPETILPLVFNNPKQVVLIGDHMQLRPVIKCTKAERLGLGQSLFSRYTEYVGMLTTQYRMHPKIMAFPSKQFYEGKLICDESVLKRPRVVNLRISSRSETIFWNVQGTEKVQHFKTAEEGNNSKYNMAEAYSVVKLLLRLESYKIPQKDIMVLSPYTAQCARIRRLIQNRHGELRNVHVGTVVTSQGSEAEYVILSAVRSLPAASIMANPNIQWLRRHLGFLTDPNQINVALTRARRRLFIIGNKTLLEADPSWEKLIKSYEHHGSVINDLVSSRGVLIP